MFSFAALGLVLGLLGSSTATERVQDCQSITYFASPGPSMNCGTCGFLTSPAILASSTGGTRDDCALQCYLKPKCESFRYNSNTTTCNYLTKPLLAQGYLNRTSPTHWVHYNVGCLTCHPSCDTDIQYFDTYSQYYFGAGKERNLTQFNSNCNPNGGHYYYNLTGTYTSDCDAITACAAHDEGASSNLEVYYFKSNQSWLCTTTYCSNTNAAFYNIEVQDVEKAYGYYPLY